MKPGGLRERRWAEGSASPSSGFVGTAVCLPLKPPSSPPELIAVPSGKTWSSSQFPPWADVSVARETPGNEAGCPRRRGGSPRSGGAVSLTAGIRSPRWVPHGLRPVVKGLWHPLQLLPPIATDMLKGGGWGRGGWALPLSCSTSPRGQLQLGIRPWWGHSFFQKALPCPLSCWLGCLSSIPSASLSSEL